MQLVLLVHPKDKEALALHPKLIVDVGNLSVVKFFVGLYFGENLSDSIGHISLSQSLDIYKLSLRSRGSGCDCAAWPL